MKLLKQKLMQMLDKVYDGDDVDKTITIEIPALMVPVTYRPEPVRMKALTVKLYGSKTDIRNDYNAQKGPGKGALYANAMGDTNPDTDPVILMINLPNVISAAPAKLKNKITEGKYTSRKSNLIPFPETREEIESKKKTKKSKKSVTTGRTPEFFFFFSHSFLCVIISVLLCL